MCNKYSKNSNTHKQKTKLNNNNTNQLTKNLGSPGKSMGATNHRKKKPAETRTGRTDCM